MVHSEYLAYPHHLPLERLEWLDSATHVYSFATTMDRTVLVALCNAILHSDGVKYWIPLMSLADAARIIYCVIRRDELRVVKRSMRHRDECFVYSELALEAIHMVLAPLIRARVFVDLSVGEDNL